MAACRNYPSIQDMLKKFIPLVNNFHDIEVVRDRVLYIANKKDNDKANDIRKKADKYHEEKKYLEAIISYTESIKMAEVNTEAMVESYLKRAITLLITNHYTECLQDLERAKDITCSTKFLETLNYLSQVAYANCTKQKTLLEKTPEIRNKHEWIDSAANCVDLVEDDTNGRHVIAARDIAVGELIAVEKPTAVYLFKDIMIYCGHCMTICLNPIPCQSCTIAHYCGDACNDAAWKKYHKYECPILLSISLYSPRIPCLLVRIALSVHDYSRNPSDELQRYDPYKEIIIQHVDLSKVKDSTVRKAACQSAQVFNLVKTYTSFFRDVEFPRKEEIFRALLIKLSLCSFDTIQIRMSSVSEFSDCHWSSASAFSSLFKTSCMPNVSIVRSSDISTIRARIPIKKGDSIVDSLCNSGSGQCKEHSESESVLCTCQVCVNYYAEHHGSYYSSRDLRICKFSTLYKQIELNRREPIVLEIILQNIANMANDIETKASKKSQMLYLYLVYRCHFALDRKLTATKYFQSNQGIEIENENPA